MRNDVPMVQYLIWAMEGRGTMSNQAIYKEVRRLCARDNRTLPPNDDAEIRTTLQAHCSTAPQFAGNRDLFTNPSDGYWLCKVTTPKLEDLL